MMRNSRGRAAKVSQFHDVCRAKQAAEGSIIANFAVVLALITVSAELTPG